MATQTIQIDGKAYVLVERSEFEQLTEQRRLAELPSYPEPDAKGNLPAREALRVSIARDIIRDRVAAGLTQRELAKLAGVRVETLCRIETGKHTPSVPTIEKIDRALKKALSRTKPKVRARK